MTNELLTAAEKYFAQYDKEMKFIEERGDTNQGYASATSRAFNKVYKEMSKEGMTGTTNDWRQIAEALQRT